MIRGACSCEFSVGARACIENSRTRRGSRDAPFSPHERDLFTNKPLSALCARHSLVPKLVIKIQTEDEVRQLLPLAQKHGTPVTFRAAGTSLSGQAVTDSILLKLSHTGKQWRRHAISDGGQTVTVEQRARVPSDETR